MENQVFKKGDVVPQWIEKTDNYNMTFETDVTVVRLADGIHVYPIHDLKENEYVMRGNAIEKDKPWSVSGSPTTVFTIPRS